MVHLALHEGDYDKLHPKAVLGRWQVDPGTKEQGHMPARKPEFSGNDLPIRHV